MLGQATSRGQVADGIRQYGVAPGGRKMIDLEAQAAQHAIDTGLYVTWRSSRNGQDCTRVGPGAKCFCGHDYQDHIFTSKKAVYPRCTTCACQRFAFIPQRPEEVGDWWLPRRKGFNVHSWRAKCRCGHSHDEHDPNTKRCMCGCPIFQSNFACVVCDRKWEDHETVFETTQERLANNMTVGDAFRPLAGDQEIQQMVFPNGTSPGAWPGTSGRQDTSMKSAVRPPQVDRRHAEKSVQIMHASSGGAIKDQGVANRWGKVERPPEEWLYHGPGSGFERLEGTERRSGSGAGALTVTGRGGGGGRPGSVSGVRGGSGSGAAGSCTGLQQQKLSGAGGPGAIGHGSAGGMGGRPAGQGGARPDSRGRGGAVGRAAVPTAAQHQQQQAVGGQPKQLQSGFRPVYD